jgi:hypothetical protein
VSEPTRITVVTRLRSFAAALALGGFALTTLIFGTRAHAREMVPTHGMMMDSAATLVAADLVRGATTLSHDRPMVVVVPVQGDSMGLLAQRLLERLQGDGRDVRLRERALSTPGMQPPTLPPGMSTAPVDDAPDPGTPTVELHVRVDGEGIAYVKRIHKFPFGLKGYERLTTMRASATWRDPKTGEVLLAKSASASVTDVVPKGDVAYATGGSHVFDTPVPRGNGIRFVEPLIVVGVVAGLVVLFYSNRN